MALPIVAMTSAEILQVRDGQIVRGELIYDAQYEVRESVQLAFLTVIQLLPPRQRAVLLLREVLGFSAAETAQILQASQAAVNSALQRARATLDTHRASGRLRPPSTPDPGAERALADRFTAAWHACDIPGLVSVLAGDCLLTMPPAPLAYRGRQATSPLPGGSPPAPTGSLPWPPTCAKAPSRGPTASWSSPSMRA
jgi:hypothetical protein